MLPGGGCSVDKSCPTLCDPMTRSTPGFPVHHLLELAQTRVYCTGDAIQPSHPLSPPLLLPSVSPSIRVFSSESSFHIRWPQSWSFSFSPSNEYSGLISFRMDWFGLVVQGTLKNLLQHHSSKAPILQCSAFLMVQLSHGHICWTLSKSLRALRRQAAPVLQREETNAFHTVKQLGLDSAFRKELGP